MQPQQTTRRKITPLPQTRGAPAAPHSTEAEQAVLGTLLVNPALFPSVAAIVGADDFFYLRHGSIWQAIADVDADPGLTVDYLTVVERLRQQGRLDDVGGPAYLTGLVNAAPASWHAEVYARLVQRAATRRAIVTAAEQIKTLAADEALTLDEAISRGNETWFGATDQHVEQGVRSFSQILGDLYDYQDSDEAPGLTLGYQELAQLHLFRGEVSYFCGLPKTGKTTFALNVARNLLRAGGCVVYLSGEISETDMAWTLLSMETGIHPADLRNRRLTPQQRSRMVSAMGHMSKWRFVAADYKQFRHFSPLEIERLLHVFLREHRVDLVIIDGFWLLEPDEEDAKRQYFEQQHAASMKLKKQAEKFNLPYMVMHQFKSPGGRAVKRPRPDDVAGGQSVRRNAQRLVALHRDSHPDLDIETDSPDVLEVWAMMDRSNSRAQGRVGKLRWLADYSTYVDAPEVEPGVALDLL